MSSPQGPQPGASQRRHARRRLVRALLALALGVSAVNVDAVEPPTLHLVFEDYPPYEFLDQGQPTGIHVSLLREVAQRLNITLRLEALPWLRAIHLAEHGEVDGIFSLFRTAEREHFLVFPEQPLSLETNVLLTSTKRPVAVTEPDDLRGLSVGVVAGNAYGAWFDNADWIDRHPVTGSERLLLKQADARTDVSVSNVSVARFLIDRLQLQEQILVLDFVVSEEPLYVAFPRAKGEASQRLAKQFAATLRELQDEGRTEAILRQYGASPHRADAAAEQPAHRTQQDRTRYPTAAARRQGAGAFDVSRNRRSHPSSSR